MLQSECPESRSESCVGKEKPIPPTVSPLKTSLLPGNCLVWSFSDFQLACITLPKAHVIESSASSRLNSHPRCQSSDFFFPSKAMISSLARTQSPLHKFQEVWSLPSSSVGEEEVLPCIGTYRGVPVTHPVGQEWDGCVGCVQDTWLDLILRLHLGTRGVTGSRLVPWELSYSGWYFQSRVCS